MTHESQIFANLLHRAAAVWRVRIDERLRPRGMTQATWRTLWALRSAAARYSQSDLAVRLGIETPTLVPILDRMETKGLLRREPDEQDRRKKIIVMTAGGEAEAATIEVEILAIRQQMLAGISEHDLQAGLRIFEQIIANAG